MESGKVRNRTLWVGVGAAVAGIVAVIVIAKWRDRDTEQMTSQIRDVQDVLKDCYEKIQQIEVHLPELKPVRTGKVPSRTGRTRKPVHES